MPKLTKKRSRKAGLPPGTLIHIGERRTEHVKLTVIDYDEKHLEEKEIKRVEECFAFKTKRTVTWINVEGVHDTEIIRKIGDHFGLHPLVQEDILNTDQRPKVEDYGGYVYMVLKMLSCSDVSGEVTAEQVSVVLGRGFVISFQEGAIGDVFDPIRERIRGAKGRLREMKADYLAYALVDAIVDNYFSILEKLGEKIEVLEEELVADSRPETLHKIHTLKREMLFLRKSVWPLREAIGRLERGESLLIRQGTQTYLRDVYDHTIQVIDTVETFRDMLSGMLDIYLSSVSNRLNAVMKVLTVIATIFMPLTFLAGLYGMNFKFMPELEWYWGYPAVLLVMAGVGISMLLYFRRKKWL